MASDIETNTQAQPSEAVCLAYSALIAALTNTTELKCEYDSGAYYGSCNCGNDYYCDPKTLQCSKDPYRGDLSKGDCDKSCH